MSDWVFFWLGRESHPIAFLQRKVCRLLNEVLPIGWNLVKQAVRLVTDPAGKLDYQAARFGVECGNAFKFAEFVVIEAAAGISQIIHRRFPRSKRRPPAIHG